MLDVIFSAIIITLALIGMGFIVADVLCILAGDTGFIKDLLDRLFPDDEPIICEDEEGNEYDYEKGEKL